MPGSTPSSPRREHAPTGWNGGNTGANQVRVRFEPSGKEAWGEVGEKLMDLALAQGIHINASCGGEGTCGTCRVKIVQGAVEGGTHPKLTESEVREGTRLACTSRLKTRELRVEVPHSSLLDRPRTARARALRGAQARTLIGGFRVDPAIFKLHLQVPPPSGDDTLPDLDRVLRTLRQTHGISPVTASLVAVRSMGPALRTSDWNITATLVNLGDRYRLIQVEPGDTSRENYAVVVDIGTTSLAAQLLDLQAFSVVDAVDEDLGTRRPMAASAMYNPQVSYGEDVISRILHASRPEGLGTLQRAVVGGINEMLGRLLARSRVPPNRISHAVVAGNSTMTQIFLGLDPTSIRKAPYVTAVSEPPVVRASQLGLELGDHVPVWCFPLVASWVGGDIVAGTLASGLWQREETTLLIDLGTNGEVVLGNRDWIVTTSCSAGPAFEGGGIRCGMRAAPGAIEDVSLDPVSLEATVWTVGAGRPRGICGSGLIAAVAELLTRGVLAPNGRYEELETPRLRPSDHGRREYVLVRAQESETGQDIVLTEVDIDNFKRAKAAVYAGCRVLLDTVGMNFGDVDRVLVAGGLGDSLDLHKSMVVGLLPPLPEDRFLFVGNSALTGSRLVTFSHELFDRARDLARQMTYVDLADNPVFMDQYVAALFLPHTDAESFRRTSDSPAGADAFP